MEQDQDQNSSDLKLLARRLAREHTARRRAKARLQVKQFELEETQQQLRVCTAELEQRIAARTAELSARNAQLERELAAARRAATQREDVINYEMLLEAPLEAFVLIEP